MAAARGGRRQGRAWPSGQRRVWQPCCGISVAKGGSGLASSGGTWAGVHVDTSSLRWTQQGGGVSVFIGFGPKTQTKRRVESGSSSETTRSHLSPAPRSSDARMARGWPGAGAGGGVGTAAALGKRGEGGPGGLPGTQAVRSSGQPGAGSQGPGCPSWGHRGSGGSERQCQPRGRCGPWRLPGTSACRSQSAGTREAGRDRERGRQEGDRGDGDETRMQR